MVLMKKFKFLLVAAFLILNFLQLQAAKYLFTCRLITIHSRTTLSQTIVR